VVKPGQGVDAGAAIYDVEAAAPIDRVVPAVAVERIVAL
jgi:hypothetical protein